MSFGAKPSLYMYAYITSCIQLTLDYSSITGWLRIRLHSLNQIIDQICKNKTKRTRAAERHIDHQLDKMASRSLVLNDYDVKSRYIVVQLSKHSLFVHIYTRITSFIYQLPHINLVPFFQLQAFFPHNLKCKTEETIRHQIKAYISCVCIIS